MKGCRSLIVWKKSDELALMTLNSFPLNMGLTSNKDFTQIISVFEEIKSMLFVLMKNQTLNP